MYGPFRALLFRLGAEPAHQVTAGAARLAQWTRAADLVEPMFAFEHEALEQTVWGLHFKNPVGLAAGFDKNATLLRIWEKLGFGFAEAGSVSAKKATGNARPRAFRLPEDRALINRMGLNNQGADRIARRIGRVRPGLGIPLGVNLAKTHDPALVGTAAVEDFRQSFRRLAPLSDYIALNISCPNTMEGKTFEEADALGSLLDAVFEERARARLEVPVLVKLSPLLNERVVYDSTIETVVDLSKRYHVAGFIAANTASDRSGLRTGEEVLEEIGPGGLSGAPVEARATQLVRYLYHKTSGNIPIIGVGGVASAEGAYAKIRAGASLVQLYTGLVYEGPGLVRDIKEGLVSLLARDGLSNIREAVGRDA